jgi:hypothetical protein
VVREGKRREGDMIELNRNELIFTFPEVHEKARLSVEFQRTLRLPDDDQAPYLPPGLGAFPLRPVADFASRLPAAWRRRGGVMMPMHQSEAMWISFHGHAGYPFLVKVAAGGIDAVSGEEWSDGVHRDPQDYVVIPDQPWIDGYRVAEGGIRQFVAMPLGQGDSAGEGIIGKAAHGGIQLLVHPMKREFWEKLRRRGFERLPLGELAYNYLCDAMPLTPEIDQAPGGRMRPHVHQDKHPFTAWDLSRRSRCIVHVADSLTWRAVTGEAPPTRPPTAEQYALAGLPWFSHYDGDLQALGESASLAGLESIGQRSRRKGVKSPPESEPVSDPVVIALGPDGKRNEVRQEEF